MSLVLPAARKVDDRQAREDAVRVVVDQSDLQTGATISIVTTVAIDHGISGKELERTMRANPDLDRRPANAKESIVGLRAHANRKVRERHATQQSRAAGNNSFIANYHMRHPSFLLP